MVQVVAAFPCLVDPYCSFDCLKVVFPLDDDDGVDIEDDSHVHCGSGYGYGCGSGSGFGFGFGSGSGSGEVDLVLVPYPYLGYVLFSAQHLSHSLAPLPAMW